MLILQPKLTNRAMLAEGLFGLMLKQMHLSSSCGHLGQLWPVGISLIFIVVALGIGSLVVPQAFPRST